MTIDLALPRDLHDRAVSQFDALLQQGKLFYTKTQPEIVTHNGFPIEFRICPILKGKQILGRDAPERVGNGGPFIDPDPAFIVAHVGDNHTLLLNLRCVYRPAYVLHTRLFARQSDDLDLADISATWAVMRTLRSGSGGGRSQMMIYNCGVDAGSSQGHKHVQIFDADTEMKLFPSYAKSTEVITSDVPNVPYEHFILRLPPSASATHVHASLQRLLDEVCRRLGPRGGGGGAAAGNINGSGESKWVDYNVVLTEDWVCVIPRRHAMRGTTGANGAAIMGLVWVRDQAERDSWDELGMTKHMAYLAVARSSS